MGRPRKKTQDQTPTEFNYDDSDALYQQVMSTGAVAPRFPQDEVDLVQSEPNIPAPKLAAENLALPKPEELFLIEGKVRLDQQGGAPVVADQRRLVVASNIDEAFAKFTKYYTDMSNPVQRYTVISAGGSEVIK